MRGSFQAPCALFSLCFLMNGCLEVEVKSASVSGINDQVIVDPPSEETTDNLDQYLEISSTLPFDDASMTETQHFGSNDYVVIKNHPAALLTDTKKDLGCYYIGPDQTVVCTQKILGLQSGYKIYGNGWLSTGKLSLSSTAKIPEANVDLGRTTRALKNAAATQLTTIGFNTALANKWVDFYPVIRDGKIWVNALYVWGDDGAGSVSATPYMLTGAAVPNPATLAEISPNDEFFSSLWALGNSVPALIRTKQAWRYETDCREKIIGVLDTGVEVGHPDLMGNLWTNPDTGSPFIHGKNFLNDSGAVDDDNGHGTHVSGLIGALGNNSIGVTGICWKARMMELKILDSEGSGAVSDFVAGISYATANGVNVLNVSLGLEGSSAAINDSVRLFLESGGVLVAAAGNGGDDGIGDNNDTASFTPSNYTHPTASLDNVIAVASIDSNSSLSSFSNFGATRVDLAAPGGYLVPGDENSDSIGSTYIDDDYVFLAGTSMAAPYVTGAVALYWSARPEKTAAQVKKALLDSVTIKAALSGKVKSSGQLNLEQFLLKP